MHLQYIIRNTMKSLQILANKIINFAPDGVKSDAIRIILDRSLTEGQKMRALFDMVKPYYRPTLSKGGNRQTFIAEKICTKIHELGVDIQSQLQIVDIGGGDGNILSLLREKNTTLSKTHLHCIEDKRWVEEYTFDKDYIDYLFWDFHKIDIADNTVELVLVMVALHHMEDSTITNALEEIKRFAKKGAYVLVKEHNASPRNLINIEWEHHLYHLLDTLKSGKELEYDAYKERNLFNFKSQRTWHAVFARHGFEQVETLNRFLENNVEKEYKNPTGLYWTIYRVKD